VTLPAQRVAGADQKAHLFILHRQDVEILAVEFRQDPGQHEIHFPGRQIAQQLARGHDVDGDIGAGCVALDLADGADEIADRRPGHRAHAHRAARAAAQRADIGGKAEHLAQDGIGAAQHGTADFGRLHPLGLADEQLGADQAFGLGQHARGGGLGHAHRFGRQLQLAMFGDLLDQAQLRRFQHQPGRR
jgi:hypothetical protein